MANTSIINPNVGLEANTTPINVSAQTVKQIVVFIFAGIILLILAQFYPHIIIGLTLLIVFGLFIYDYQQITNFLTKDL